MRKTLSAAFPILPSLSVGSPLWALLAGELATSLLLLATGQVPHVAVQALQLFLRF